MNGIRLTGADAQDKRKVAEFIRAVNSLNERIDYLKTWKKQAILRNLREAGFSGAEDIDLAAYLQAFGGDNLSKLLASLPLWSFFAAKYSPPKDWKTAVPAAVYYTSEKEIRCVFYALVVRKQALEGKYKGGLEGYLKRHGGQYNDEIAVICYMSPEWGPQVTDLEANGLESSKDFIILIDDRYGPPFFHKGFEPYPFDVSWLRGYYHEGGIMVSLVS